jgi:hypothetical protein
LKISADLAHANKSELYDTPIQLPKIGNNDLVNNWPGRAKFVDDLVVVETIPRNSISVMDLVARKIQQYCMDHKMKLNPKKCREMFVNFMTNPSILSRDL